MRSVVSVAPVLALVLWACTAVFGLAQAQTKDRAGDSGQMAAPTAPAPAASQLSPAVSSPRPSALGLATRAPASRDRCQD